MTLIEFVLMIFAVIIFGGVVSDYLSLSLR